MRIQLFRMCIFIDLGEEGKEGFLGKVMAVNKLAIKVSIGNVRNVD